MDAMRWFVFLIVFSVHANEIKKNASLLYKNNNFEEAKNLIQTFLLKHPSDMEAIELAGDISIAQKNWDEAIRYFEKLIRFDSKNADYQYKYGGTLGMKALSVSKWESLSYLGDMRKAFEKSISLDPYHLGAHWALISFHCEVPGILGGSRKKANKYAQSLIRLSTLDGLLAYAFLAQQEGKKELAEKFLDEAKINVNSNQAKEQLLFIYKQITYHNKIDFEEFMKLTQKYRPESVAKKIS